MVSVMAALVVSRPALAQNVPVGHEAKDHGVRVEKPHQGPAWTSEGPDEGAVLKLIRDPAARDKFGITEEQVSRLQEGLSGLHGKVVEMRSQLEQAAMDQARMMTAPDVDERTVLAQVEKTGKIRTEIARLRIKTLLTLKRTLTPQQIDQIKSNMQRVERGRGAEKPARPRDGHGLDAPAPVKMPHPREAANAATE